MTPLSHSSTSQKLGPYPLNSIITGDARELAQAIPDESVDLIFTDPPYDDESVPLYGWLAETAARILKPGGFCFAYTGNRWLNKILPLMNESLDFFWMICGYQPESNTVFYDKNIGTGWRPILIYSKGAKRAPRFMQDTRKTTEYQKRILDAVNDGRDVLEVWEEVTAAGAEFTTAVWVKLPNPVRDMIKAERDKRATKTS